jgi:hypothetical protein
VKQNTGRKVLQYEVAENEIDGTVWDSREIRTIALQPANIGNLTMQRARAFEHFLRHVTRKYVVESLGKASRHSPCPAPKFQHRLAFWGKLMSLEYVCGEMLVIVFT